MGTTVSSRQITEGNIWKQLLIFFFPILLGSFFQQMYNTVDTIVVGRELGTSALAAVGCTGSLVNMVNGLFTGIGSGATVILSQFYGANLLADTKRTLQTGFTLSVVLGAVVTVLGTLGGPWVLALMKTPEDCLVLASQYIRIFFSGAIGSMVYNMGAGILRAMGDSKRPMIYLIITCFLNIFLDILFVRWLRMGVAGAAAATVVSQFISAGLLTAALCRRQDCPLDLRHLKLEKALMGRILRIGVPAGLQFVTFDFSNILIQSGINSFGDATMAAWTAYAKTDGMTWMVCGAFGVAVTTFVGQNFGAQKYRRIRQSVRACLIMGIASEILLSAVVLLFREPILGIYIKDPEVIEIGSVIMLSIVPFNFTFMPVEVFGGTLRGVGDAATPTAISGICVCLLRIIWLLTGVKALHTLNSLTICYPVTWILASVVFSVIYLRGNWLSKRIAACGMAPESR